MIKVHSQLPSMQKLSEKFQITNASAIEVDGLVFVSGLPGVDLSTGEITPGEDIREHSRQALRAVELVVGEIGLTLDNVVKVNVFLAEPARDWAGWNEVFKATFNSPHPCRTSVGATLLVGLLEVDVVLSRESRVQAS